MPEKTDDRLHRLVRGLNSIAAALPFVDEVVAAGASAAESLTGAESCTVTVLNDGRARRFEVGELDPDGAQLSVGLKQGEGEVGTLTLGKRGRDAFSDEDADAVALIGEGLAAQIVHALAYEKALEESRVDPLTGLGNRRDFEERLTWEMNRASRYSEKLSLALFEIDDLAGIRARLGPEDSDELVVEIAEVLSRGRSADSCFRLESDTFAVVMPNTPVQGAEIAAIRMAWNVAVLRGGGIVTLTSGVAEAEVPDTRAWLEAAEGSLRAARLPVDA